MSSDVLSNYQMCCALSSHICFHSQPYEISFRCQHLLFVSKNYLVQIFVFIILFGIVFGYISDFCKITNLPYCAIHQNTEQSPTDMMDISQDQQCLLMLYAAYLSQNYIHRYPRTLQM